jgi:hypothetical protein
VVDWLKATGRGSGRAYEGDGAIRASYVIMSLGASNISAKTPPTQATWVGKSNIKPRSLVLSAFGLSEKEISELPPLLCVRRRFSPVPTVIRSPRQLAP